jgi:hypothetical protein
MDGEAATSAAPSGYSNLFEGNTGTAGSANANARAVGASKAATASSENPGAFTSPAPATGWTGITIAIYPAGTPIVPSFTAATSTSAAQTLSVTKTIRKTLTAITSTSAAQTLDIPKLTAVTSVNTAQTLSVTKPIRKTLTAGAETDAAIGLSYFIDTSKTLTPVTESDTAPAQNVDKHKTLLATSELGAAQQAIYVQSRTLTPGSETDLAIGATPEEPPDVETGPLHRTDVYGKWAFVRGPARLLVAEMNEPFPEQIGDIIVPSGAASAIYDARPGWTDVGATKGGVQISKQSQEEVFALNQDTGHIESHPFNWTYNVQANVAEMTLQSIRIAWGISPTIINITPNLTERQQGFGQAHKKTPRRLAVLYQDKKTLKIRAFVFRRVFISGNESAMNFQKTGDQQVLTIQFNSVLSQEDGIYDIRKRFFTVFEQK